MMKILHLSTFDRCGGAAIAAYRLHKGLRQIGVDSQMLVQKKSSEDSSIMGLNSIQNKIMNIIRSELNKMPIKFYKKGQEYFSNQMFSNNLIDRIKKIDPDIVHLHWVCANYLSIRQISKIKKPIVWTLHDMWPMTGGCPYSGGCERYKEACGCCPMLNSKDSKDLSNKINSQKRNEWNTKNMTLIAPSAWMADCARSSSLFKKSRVEVIKHGIDIKKFKPINKKAARTELNLPENKRLILAGAVYIKDRRKGVHLLLRALEKLEDKKDIELLIFGNQRLQKDCFGFKIHQLGYIKDEEALVNMYSCADVMVVPSLQESFGQTASESLACGTPVVAFNTTGLKDIVEHKKNGYLAKPFDTADLAEGISWVLENDKRQRILSENARYKVLREFDLTLQAEKYKRLYKEILKNE